MIWYVEKTLELAGKRHVSTSGSVQQHPRHEELCIHALQILTRAAEIAPAQADLFLRIANIQCESGDITSATSNLRRIAVIKSATPVDLQQAAQLLINLNDAVGAVTCLEKALDIEQDISENIFLPGGIWKKQSPLWF